MRSPGGGDDENVDGGKRANAGMSPGSILTAALLSGLIAETAGAGPEIEAPSFTVDPFWPKPLPDPWLLGAVVGVAVDARPLLSDAGLAG